MRRFRHAGLGWFPGAGVGGPRVPPPPPAAPNLTPLLDSLREAAESHRAPFNATQPYASDKPAKPGFVAVYPTRRQAVVS